MQPVFLNFLALGLLIGLFTLPAIYIPGVLLVTGQPIFLLYLILWMGLHEIIHALGFGIIGEIFRKEQFITFGIKLEVGVFYCMCKKEISKKRILLSLLLPLVTIGILTLIIGLIYSLPLLIVLSLVNIAGAAGDIIMTIAFLRMGPMTYLDLDDPIGFVVISENKLDQKKYLGLKIIESGPFTKKITPKIYKRFIISKPSIIIMGILVLLALLGLLF